MKIVVVVFFVFSVFLFDGCKNNTSVNEYMKEDIVKPVRRDVHHYLSMHESIVSRSMAETDDTVDVRFTTFGHRAGCHAVYDIIKSLPEEEQSKLIILMQSKGR
jgi:hypothetical protein